MNEFVAIDLETTGLDPDRDSIIEIGAVRFAEGHEVESWQTFVQPASPLPLAIQQLTGIQDEMLAGAPSLAEVLPALADFIGMRLLVAHNATFDLGFLNPAFRQMRLRLSADSIDTLSLARLLLPLAKSHRLGQLAARLALPLEQGHRALEDARACGHLLLALEQAAEQLPLPVLAELDRLLQSANWEGRHVINRALSHVASSFPQRALGSDGPLPSAPSREEEAGSRPAAEFSPAACAELLGPDGPLARAYPGYESRRGQMAMAKAVGEAFEGGRHLLVEAGTGTGKSLAYLVPAVQWALAQGERVAVATHTINLQEQLWEKDLPLLRQVLGVPFKAALVKGRSHYLCLRKHRELVEHEAATLPPEEAFFQARLVTWVRETETGDRSELGLFGEEEEYWGRVASEVETCLGPKCPFHARQCFYYRNRRQAEEADVLIANHSLILVDLGMNRQLLPEYKRLVVDEAHHLEETATKQWGLEVSEGALMRFLGGLTDSRRGRGQGRPGFLSQLRRSLHLDGPDGADARDKLGQIGDQAHSARDAAEDVFASLKALAGGLGRRADDETPFTLRLREEQRQAAAYRPVDAARINLSARLRALAKSLGDLSALLADTPLPDRRLDGLLLELDRYAAASYEYASDLDFILCGHGEGYVHWLELGRTAQLRAAPVRIGPELQEKLFNVIGTVVMTSATLTVAGRFDHLRERLGMDDLGNDRVDCLAVPSPFQYREQVLLCIPQDLPTPRDGEAAWAGAVEDALLRLVLTTEGRTLVLFTSHRMLRQVYQRLRPELEQVGITLLGQGLDGSRNRILEAFLANRRSVLFGASSFWEGVDVPGDGLTCVVMVRLPFAPPGEPVTEARLEDLEQRGLSAFEHLSLPQAVMRFKQGFGRLVRSRTDRGVVVVFDGRLGSGQARYAARFIDSLPGPALLRAPLSQVVEEVRAFLAAGSEADAG
ncbi:MAG: helicase C-terminal domain-containing protein [Symbiobacteriia bacterium]